jgi:hypothetical protein
MLVTIAVATRIIKEVTDGLDQAAVLSYRQLRDLTARRSDWSIPGPPWVRAERAARVDRDL